jgi:hypothetical protein
MWLVKLPRNKLLLADTSATSKCKNELVETLLLETPCSYEESRRRLRESSSWSRFTGHRPSTGVFFDVLPGTIFSALGTVHE